MALRDAWRISEAIKARKDGVWLFCVVTCSPKRIKYYSPERCFIDWDTNFKKVVRKLKADLISTNAVIIQVMEQTRRAYPHSNCLIFVPSQIASKYEKLDKKVKTWLKKHLPSLGFGFMTSVAVVDETTLPKIARYVTKAGGNDEFSTLGVAMEASKSGTQLPIFMPRAGRRIRTSPRVLPSARAYFAFVEKLMTKGKSLEELLQDASDFNDKKESRMDLYQGIQNAKIRNKNAAMTKIEPSPSVP